ncbi:MAG: phBC6A51 family helix-turn-helix protein [Nanoarchaeota archaeon]
MSEQLRQKSVKQQKVTKKKLSKKARQELFLKLYLSKKGHIGMLCKEVGIERTQYYRWLKEKKFAQKIDNLVESINDSVEYKILEQIEEMGDRELLKLWAKTKMRHRGFVERTEIEHSGNLPINIQIVQKEDEPTEQDRTE